MKKIGSSHAVSGVFVFLLLGLFAVFSTVMVVLGAKAYKGTADRLYWHNAGRIGTAYVRTVARSGDALNAVRVDDMDGLPVVTLRFEYDGDEYLNRIFVYGGMLREWFTGADMDFEPENGEPLCPCDEMTATLEGGLLRVGLRKGEDWDWVEAALRCPVN